MDLFIHTLTGTIFELRVSPFETIQSIKSKVQRLEGIAMSQQHLIWRSLELEDGYCLHDYGIKSGATLTLVLAMRGGPINMRRVSLEEPSLQEMAEYMDENRDELWDKIMNDNKHVTLLVYREGDQLNFFRVYDGSPGTISPYSDSISATSYNGHDDETPPANKDNIEENLITKGKMRVLRQRITTKNTNTKKLPTLQPTRPPSSVLPSTNLAKRRIQFTKQTKRDFLSPCCVAQNSHSNSNRSIHFDKTPSPIKLDTMPKELQGKDLAKNILPTITRTKDSESAELISPNDEVSDSSLPSNLSNHSPGLACSPLKNTRTLPDLYNNNNELLVKTMKDDSYTRKSARTKGRSLKPLGAVDKSVSNKLFQQMIQKYPPAPPALGDTKESNDTTSPRVKKCSRGTSGITKQSKSVTLPPAAKDSSGAILPRLQPSVFHADESSLDTQLDETLKHSQLPDIIRDPVEYENYKNLLKWVYPGGKEDGEKVSVTNFKPKVEKESNLYSRPMSKTRRKVEGRPSSRVRSSKLYAHGNLPHLPPVVHSEHRNIPTLTGKKKPRCSMCTKKLGLATTYQCRCGIKFCAKHRYPEAHSCTYDYKAEGRRLLERSNPVVTAPKLPKI